MTAQLELALSAPKPTATGYEWGKNPRKDARRRHARDEAPYNPRALRRFLLRHLSFVEWTGFIGMADEAGQSVEALSWVLDMLEHLGRIEKTPLYFYHCTGLVKPDRTVHPGHGPRQYQGFEFGYRLVGSPRRA